MPEGCDGLLKTQKPAPGTEENGSHSGTAAQTAQNSSQELPHEGG